MTARIRIGSALAALAVAVTSTAWAATPTTVGNAHFTDGVTCGGPGILADTAYVFGDGAVTSFAYQTGTRSSTGTGTAGEQLAFEVLRPLGDDEYEVVGSSGLVTLTKSDGTIETFTPAAPIATQAGDLLGIYLDADLTGCVDLQPGGHVITNFLNAEPPVGSSVSIPFAHPEYGDINAAASVDPLAQPRPTCNGQTATIYPGSGYPGTSTDPNAPMTVIGTRGADVIVTGNAGDRVSGGGGGDVICTGNGADKASGGGGGDVLSGGTGHDSLGGNAGDDRVDGGSGDDYVRGGTGDDEVHGGADDDVLAGNEGEDACFGRANGTWDRVIKGGSCETFAVGD